MTLGDATARGLSREAKTNAQTLLLAGLISDEHLDDRGLDAFLADVRKLADQILGGQGRAAVTISDGMVAAMRTYLAALHTDSDADLDDSDRQFSRCSRQTGSKGSASCSSPHSPSRPGAGSPRPGARRRSSIS